MKKERIGYVSVEEYWAPSVQLRYVKRLVPEFGQIQENMQVCKIEIILQQLFTSNLGNREWKDVPVENNQN